MSESPTYEPVADPAPREPREQAKRPVASPVPREPTGETKRCSHTTRAGRPCHAWAIHGTDPPTCSAHAKRSKGAGAPKGNQNARKHGFYGRALSPEELADLLDDADLNLAAEIVCARIALRRVLQYLATDPGDLSSTDHVRALALVFHGTRTIARLLRDFHALGGDINRLAETARQVITKMSAEWNIDL